MSNACIHVHTNTIQNSGNASIHVPVPYLVFAEWIFRVRKFFILRLISMLLQRWLICLFACSFNCIFRFFFLFDFFSFFSSLLRYSVEKSRNDSGQIHSIEQFWVNLFYSFIQPRIPSEKVRAVPKRRYSNWKNNRIYHKHLHIPVPITIHSRVKFHSMIPVEMNKGFTFCGSMWMRVVYRSWMWTKSAVNQCTPFSNRPLWIYCDRRAAAVFFGLVDCILFHYSMDAVLYGAYTNCFILSNEPIFYAENADVNSQEWLGYMGSISIVGQNNSAIFFLTIRHKQNMEHRVYVVDALPYKTAKLHNSHSNYFHFLFCYGQCQPWHSLCATYFYGFHSERGKNRNSNAENMHIAHAHMSVLKNTKLWPFFPVKWFVLASACAWRSFVNLLLSRLILRVFFSVCLFPLQINRITANGEEKRNRSW